MWNHPRLSISNGFGQQLGPALARAARKRKVPFRLTAMISACLLISTASPGEAKTWRSEGNWLISGSPKLGGCVMATRYASGAFLSISAVHSSNGQRIWEILVSVRAWEDIQSEKVYTVNVHFLGAAQKSRQLEMTGYKTYGTHSLVSNALVFVFVESSDHMAFVTEGLETGLNISFVLDGKPLGLFSLEHASTAYHDMKVCLGSRASNYET
jgi:hypothetical protein